MRTPCHTEGSAPAFAALWKSRFSKSFPKKGLQELLRAVKIGISFFTGSSKSTAYYFQINPANNLQCNFFFMGYITDMIDFAACFERDAMHRRAESVLLKLLRFD